MSEQIRVLVVDDEEIVRTGLRLVLDSQPDLLVVGEASDGAEAVALAAEFLPDVVLMDVQMPGTDGLEATRLITELSETHPDQPLVRVIILTTFELDEYVYEALRAGASGFLLKRTRPEELTGAIRVVAGGEALLAPSITRKLIAQFARRLPVAVAAPADLQRLTDRERDVLAEVARGYSNSEIASRLFVSEQTVKTHVKHIFTKIGIRDRAQAVVFAYENGFVKAGG
ncbi:MAG TPA: DNA-binding response regulator [Acidimicrobiaceae bacterium]|nr:DNA-binding response regulator [Acidimicrobiaceae bacterium]